MRAQFGGPRGVVLALQPEERFPDRQRAAEGLASCSGSSRSWRSTAIPRREAEPAGDQPGRREEAAAAASTVGRGGAPGSRS